MKYEDLPQEERKALTNRIAADINPRERVQSYIKDNITDGKDPLFHDYPNQSENKDRIQMVDKSTLNQMVAKAESQANKKILGSDFVAMYNKVMELQKTLNESKSFLVSFFARPFQGSENELQLTILVRGVDTFEAAAKKIQDSGKFEKPHNFKSLTI